MPGTNAGTGRPLTFRCVKCRRGRRLNTGWPGRIALTGKTRGDVVSTAFHRMCRGSFQYRCLDCGHIGWSRHVDLQRIAGRA